MRTVFPLICATLFGSMALPVLAAENHLYLQETSGKVLITTDSGTVSANVGRKIENGTRILVGENARARVASADGSCNVTLPSEKVTVINKKMLCEVQITPTAIDGASAGGGIPPAAVGLGFFAAVTIAGTLSIVQNDSDPLSAP